MLRSTALFPTKREAKADARKVLGATVHENDSFVVVTYGRKKHGWENRPQPMLPFYGDAHDDSRTAR